MAEREQTLSEKAADRIIENIRERGLGPGDKIGTEMELTDALGVSRSTVREAIRLLVSRNVLESRHGSGTYVSEKKGVADDPLGLNLLHDQVKLAWDLLEVRYLLEPQLAYAAALNATDEQLAELKEICDQMDSLSASGQKRLDVDIRFHMAVLEASRNLVASNLYPILEKAVEMFIHYTQREYEPESVATHRDIVEALIHRDPDWAKDMMRMHLELNRQLLRHAALKNGEDLNSLKGGRIC